MIQVSKEIQSVNIGNKEALHEHMRCLGTCSVHFVGCFEYADHGSKPHNSPVSLLRQTQVTLVP